MLICASGWALSMWLRHPETQICARCPHIESKQSSRIWLVQNHNRIRKHHNGKTWAKWLKVATSSRSGYFGMPCGAKKNLGRVEKFEKTRFFQYFYWRILEIYWNLKFWKKLSHKNAIKMIWGVLFFIAKQKNISNCGSFDQNCGSFLTRFWGYFLALFGSESGAFWFKTFSQFAEGQRSASVSVRLFFVSYITQL